MSSVSITPERIAWLKSIKAGDQVVRLLAGEIPMTLRVTDVTDDIIACGSWTFNRATGGEIDEDLGWDGVSATGSFLKQ